VGNERTLIVGNIILSPYENEETAIERAARTLHQSGLFAKPLEFSVFRKSVDARRKNCVRVVWSVAVKCECGRLDPIIMNKYSIYELEEQEITVLKGSEEINGRPVIIGMGPAGLFCALMLAKNGYKPLILERGDDVDRRSAAKEKFYSSAVLDTESNVQFGAGGAGTFSDGKLITRINDAKCTWVLKTFTRFGAPEDILTKAKPHIGTDLLKTIVKNIANEICGCGGEISYRTCAKEFISDSAGAVRAIKTSNGEIKCGPVILATGQSARDTYMMLLNSGIAAECKPFSAGVRIEHLCADIDDAMYGSFAGLPSLGHAEYSLSHRLGERGGYTFCMCPGGEVVAAASENGGVVTNGMSCYARDGRNSNSALAVSVFPSDYDSTPRGAIEFQRRLERTAFTLGGGGFRAPLTTVGDFLAGKSGTEPSTVESTYMGGGKYTLCNFNKLLPPFICDTLRASIRMFDRRLEGFAAPFALLTGTESRTSAPLRILRGDNRVSLTLTNLYPCGEGAGYAGGITSSAVDGLKTALAVMERYAKPD